MRRFSILAASVAASFSLGCGGAASHSASGPAVTPLASTMATPAVDTPADGALVEAPEAVSFDPTGLPTAPWSTAALRSDQVPSSLLQAWARAENREVCAPLAPEQLDEGSTARVSDMIEGGWAVEFDRRGMPGLSASGDSCRRCGRAVFGIAGTNMAPDEVVMEDEDGQSAIPSYADGSHLLVEPPAEGESVAAATITVGGQGCVYQVWSFLGEEHVRQLVSQLRMVEVRETATIAAR